MRVCLVVALLLVKGIYMYPECNGSIIVREPVIQNRSIMVTFTSASLDQYTAVWTIAKGSSWYKQEQFPLMFVNLFQNSSICRLILTIDMNIIPWRSFNLRVELKDAQNKAVCHKDKTIEMADLGECGNLRVSDTFIREGRSVDLELRLKHRQENPSFTLLFINDANDQAILNLENMHGRTLPFTYTLDSPRSDGIYLVMCDADAKTFSTILRLEKAEKPSDPILKDLELGLSGCNRCIFVDITAVENWFRIKCNVSGGTDPKNVTISVGTHRVRGRLDNYVYIADIKKDHLRHNSEVICEVLNPALAHALNTTARLYIKKKPKNTEIKFSDIVAGEEGTIKCVSTDMRPAINLTVDLEGSSCNRTQDVIHNTIVDTYNVTATCLFTANKTLHNKRVNCCLGKQSGSSCSSKQLNVSFPPDQVKAVFFDERNKFNSTALICYVSRANPPCRARWEIPPEITDYRSENFKSTIGLNDGEEILSKLILNATRLNHGQQIQCLAVCGNFEVESNVVSLNVPGAPLMKVFPGNMVTKREGETLTLNCTVDSIPKSNISWNHGNDILSESGSTRCDNYSKCYRTYNFESLGKSQTGNYTCTAHNDQFEPTKEIVLLRVIEPDSVTGNNENLMKKTWFILAVAGGGAAVLIVIIIVVVITVSRRKKAKTNSMKPNGHNERQDAGDQIQGEIEEEHDANIGGEQGAGVENVTYATVVKDNVRPSTSKDRQVSHDDVQESKEESKEGGNASSITEQVQIDNTYAQVLPRAERQKQSQNVKASASGEKELIYLDVEFNKALPGSKVKGGRQSDVERTEYVSIDFNKKAPTDS